MQTLITSFFYIFKISYFHILTQCNVLPYPFLSSLFVSQMGMQYLLYSRSSPPFVTVIIVSMLV